MVDQISDRPFCVFAMVASMLLCIDPIGVANPNINLTVKHDWVPSILLKKWLRGIKYTE
jgi:hypothetical protein